MVQEPAAKVVKMELARLDALLNAHYEHALAGEIPSTEMCLRIMEKRGRLLGLFPQQGQQSVFALHIAGEVNVEPLAIEFVQSSHRNEPMHDVTPAPRTIDLEANPPHSGVPLVKPHIDRSKDSPVDSLCGDSLPDPRSGLSAFVQCKWNWS